MWPYYVTLGLRCFCVCGRKRLNKPKMAVIPRKDKVACDFYKFSSHRLDSWPTFFTTLNVPDEPDFVLGRLLAAHILYNWARPYYKYLLPLPWRKGHIRTSLFEFHLTTYLWSLSCPPVSTVFQQAGWVLYVASPAGGEYTFSLDAVHTTIPILTLCCPTITVPSSSS